MLAVQVKDKVAIRLCEDSEVLPEKSLEIRLRVELFQVLHDEVVWRFVREPGCKPAFRIRAWKTGETLPDRSSTRPTSVEVTAS